MEPQPRTCLIDGALVALPAGSNASAEHIESALLAADRIHATGSWRKLQPNERANLLSKVCDQLNETISHAMAAADARETGVPITITRMINGSLKEAFSSEALEPLCEAASPKAMRTAQGAMRMLSRPHGPALILAPWNVPSGTVVAKLIAALIAGCPVIVKPSEIAPLGLELFLKAVQNAGLPDGVLQWLHGGADVGDSLVKDARVRVIHFTGSTIVGQQIARACSERLVPILMECGGSNVAIVLGDADVQTAAKAIASGITTLNGQWCAGITRVLVHESILEDLVKSVLVIIQKLKAGAAEDDATEYGPLSHRAHFERMESTLAELQERGGEVHQASGIGSVSDLIFPPTLVTGLAASDQQDEIFGPIATVQPFTDATELAQVVNRRPMLQSYIFSRDTERAFAVGLELECGSVMVNGVGFGFEGTCTEGGEPCEPTFAFFGTSGYGTEAGGPATVRFFAGAQTIGVGPSIE